MAALPDRAAPLPLDGARADHEGRLGSRGARRGEGARAGSKAEGGRGRGGLRLLSVLLPQPGARAAGGRDRARGVPGGVPVGLLGGAAAVPRVRAFLDRLPERLRRAQGRHLCPSAAGAAAGPRREDRRAPDDLGERRRDGRGRGGAPGQPAHVRPRSGRRGRHLGGEAGRLRQRHHARCRRHLGGHRPRPAGPSAHEAPAGHEGRPLPGDDPDGGRRHDRRRGRLDRVRRPGRDLPRGAAIGRCRSLARLPTGGAGRSRRPPTRW